MVPSIEYVTWADSVIGWFCRVIDNVFCCCFFQRSKHLYFAINIVGVFKYEQLYKYKRLQRYRLQMVLNVSFV